MYLLEIFLLVNCLMNNSRTKHFSFRPTTPILFKFDQARVVYLTPADQTIRAMSLFSTPVIIIGSNNDNNDFTIV